MLENGTLAVDAEELEELLAEVEVLEDLLAELFELLPHAATTTASAHAATDVHHQRLILMLSLQVCDRIAGALKSRCTVTPVEG